MPKDEKGKPEKEYTIVVNGREKTVTATELGEDDLVAVVVTAKQGGVGGADIRLVKPLYIPRMHFSYTLSDASGATLQSADVKLKDMSFMDRGTRINRRSENLTYEKAMIRDWFEKTLEQTAATPQ
mgnify:CR=1 FL=1